MWNVNRSIVRCGLLLGAVAFGAAFTANASPITITALYASGIDAADMAVIQTAIDFYNTNITTLDAVNITVAFGTQAGGGAQSTTFLGTAVSYSSYLAILNGTQTSANDATALASLPAGPPNPVTGSTDVLLSNVLTAALGFSGAPTVGAFSECDGLTAVACIQIGTNVLTGGPGGTPNASLMGTTEHELDEVLGTSSALSGTSSPADPDAADLFRYAAPGVRSFSTNSSTAEPCDAGTPAAYFSIDGGATNLNAYNNCNNGGDYGDWSEDTGLQVQDAFGPDDVASSLSITSPEVTLLDAVGYNAAQGASATPEPSTWATLLVGIAGLIVWRQRAKPAV